MSIFNTALRACSISTWTRNLPKQATSYVHSTTARKTWQENATSYFYSTSDRNWKYEVTSLNQEIKNLRNLLDNPHCLDSVDFHLQQAFFDIQQLEENGAPPQLIDSLYRTANDVKRLFERRQWTKNNT